MTEPENTNPADRAEARHSLLCRAADLVVAEGIDYARRDDPHLFGSLPQQFDQGKARRRLVLDYLPGGQVRIAVLLHGTLHGEPQVVQLFATVMQGPAAEPQH